MTTYAALPAGAVVPVSAPRRAVTTAAGRYLRAIAHDETPDRLGAPAPPDDRARRIWKLAFGFAVRRRFDDDTPLAELSRSVAAAVRRHAAACLPTLDAEMLVRAELGEAVPVNGMDAEIVTAVHILLFASFVDEMALDGGEVDELIADAERIAG